MTDIENHDEDGTDTNDNVVAITKPAFNIGETVSSIDDAEEIAMVRGYSSDDGKWRYTLSHSIKGSVYADEAELELYKVSPELLMRHAELYLMKAQRSYRGLVEQKEFKAAIELTQYSDTHDTVITHKVVGGGGYGANTVSLEGSDLLELTDTAKWDMYKRNQLAPKQLTRYRG